MLRLTSWAQSDLGKKRLNNEDSFYHDPKKGLFIVADGMGGHKGGDHASHIATTTVRDIFYQLLKDAKSTKDALEQAFYAAALNVYSEGISNINLKGMGTTLSVLVINDEQALIGHIGDTRIYCLRDGKIHQLTNDHSLVNEHVQAGIMSSEEARLSSLRNIITRAIGHDKYVKPDFLSASINKGDIFLLCSDGLNNMLIDDEICQILNINPPESAVEKLITAANDKGGDDNITVIIVRVGQ